MSLLRKMRYIGWGVSRVYEILFSLVPQILNASSKIRRKGLTLPGILEEAHVVSPTKEVRKKEVEQSSQLLLFTLCSQPSCACHEPLRHAKLP